MIKTKLDEIPWIETDNKINGWKSTKENIENLYSWVRNHPQFINLTLTNDHVNIKDNTTRGVIIKKLISFITVRELHNY